LKLEYVLCIPFKTETYICEVMNKF